MVWSINIGQSAPGLGMVIDMQQPNPSYNKNQRYSGYNAQLCLIAVSNNGNTINPRPFCIAMWHYGEEEPRRPDYFMSHFDSAVNMWNEVRKQM